MEIKPIDRQLTGIEFCVMGTAKDLPSVEELTVLLKLHNASITSFPRINKTFAIVAGDLNSRNIRNYTKKPKPEENQNVIKAEWVVKNLLPDKPLKFTPRIVPRDFLFISDKLKERFERKFDKFGDSYADPIENVKNLNDIINDMTECDMPTTNDLKQFEDELHDVYFKNPNFFRGMTGVFIYPDTKITFINIAEQCFKFRGGKVIKEGEDKTAKVFVDQRHYDNVNSDRETISYQWILDSNEAGKILDSEKYVI